MKILGKSSDTPSYNDTTFIVEISSNELEHIFSSSYSSDLTNKMRKLKIGDEVDMSTAFRYYEGIKSMFKNMQDTIDKFEKTKDIIYNFSRIMGPSVDNEKDSRTSD